MAENELENMKSDWQHKMQGKGQKTALRSECKIDEANETKT